jgi:DNA-binding SARP family transcriptional activator
VRPRQGRWLAWSLCAVSVAAAVAGSFLNIVGDPASPELDYDVVFFAVFLTFTLVGLLIVIRRPDNPIGWLLLVNGLLWQLSGFLAGYANYVLFVSSGSLPGGTFAAWVLSWLWVPAIGMIPFLFLLFPDSQLRSRRWRSVLWLAIIGTVLVLAARMVAPGPMSNAASIPNPFGRETGGPIMTVAGAAGNLLLAATSWAAILGLVLRFRHARGTERLQLRWLAFAGGVVLAVFVLADAVAAIGYPALADSFEAAGLPAIPVAVGIAILRHRLYDIDVLISRTVVFGGLAVFVTAVYLIAVAGVGTVVGRGVGSNVGLAVVATAVVAVALQPLREHLERAARGLVFGKPTAAEESAGVAIHCLGAFRVVREGGIVPVNAWQSRKARTLLKILVARRGRATTREFLMEALWPEEDPDVVTRRLSVAQATVRAVLDPDKRHPPDYFLISTKDAMRVDLTHLPVDVERFLAAAAEGLTHYRDGNAVAARQHLEIAEGVYDGDFLEEDLYEDWAVPLREEARATRISVSRALAELAAATADVDAAVRHYLRILDTDPWDATAHLALVRVLDTSGRHGEARRRYRAYASRMEEIGVSVAPFASADPA